MLRWSIRGIAFALLFASLPRAQAQDRYFDSKGVKVRFIEQGKGEPVLLIHGFGASVEMQWLLPGVVKSLAKDYRVIALDLRGHGKSGKPHDVESYGVQMVEDAVRLLDHLHIQKAHVVGYSMGAMVAAKLLVSHPDRLRTVTLGGAGPMVNDERLTQFTDKLAESLEQGKGIAPLIEALTPPGKSRPPEEIKAVSQLFCTFNDTKALSAVVRSWKDLAVTDAQLKANRIPTLVLIGANDPLKKLVDSLSSRMSDVQMVVIPDADHILAFTRPQFREALKKFLDEHR